MNVRPNAFLNVYLGVIPRARIHVMIRAVHYVMRRVKAIVLVGVTLVVTMVAMVALDHVNRGVAMDAMEFVCSHAKQFLRAVSLTQVVL